MSPDQIREALHELPGILSLFELSLVRRMSTFSFTHEVATAIKDERRGYCHDFVYVFAPCAGDSGPPLIRVGITDEGFATLADRVSAFEFEELLLVDEACRLEADRLRKETH